MGLAPPRSLSPSSSSSFKQCPLAFKFSYLDRLPEPPSVWTSKGTLVHRALELLLDRPPDERTPDAAQADLAQARVELAPHPDFADLRLSDEEWEAFDSVGGLRSFCGPRAAGANPLWYTFEARGEPRRKRRGKP